MEEPYVIAALEVACCDPSLQGINPGQITYDPEPDRLRFGNPGRLYEPTPLEWCGQSVVPSSLDAPSQINRA